MRQIANGLLCICCPPWLCVAIVEHWSMIYMMWRSVICRFRRIDLVDNVYDIWSTIYDMIYDIWHIINDKCNVMFNDLSFQEDRLGGQGGSGGAYWWYQQDEIGWRLAEIRFYIIGLWLLENILSLDWNRIFRLIMMQRHFWTLFKRWSFSLLTKIGDNLQWNFCQPVPLPCHGHAPCLWVNWDYYISHCYLKRNYNIVHTTAILPAFEWIGITIFQIDIKFFFTLPHNSAMTSQDKISPVVLNLSKEI